MHQNNFIHLKKKKTLWNYLPFITVKYFYASCKSERPLNHFIFKCMNHFFLLVLLEKHPTVRRGIKITLWECSKIIINNTFREFYFSKKEEKYRKEYCIEPIWFYQQHKVWKQLWFCVAEVNVLLVHPREKKKGQSF